MREITVPLILYSIYRSTSHSTLYSRAKSFSSLGTLHDETNFMNESLLDVTSLCHDAKPDTKSLKSLSLKDLASNIDTSKYEEFTSNGGYLGWFSKEPSGKIVKYRSVHVCDCLHYRTTLALLFLDQSHL